MLRDHPDQSLVDYVTNGLKHGFSTGFRGALPRSASSNLKSSSEHSADVSKAIRTEVSRGHTAGPFNTPPLDDFHCSPLGAVPKKDGSARIILDLSSPRGSSVNEGIDNHTFTVKYCSIDDALDMVHSLGPSAFMAKADIKHAFRLCPVKPNEWHLLGYQWNGDFYYDMVLPFGSRSSPFIFNSFADLLCWILNEIALIRLIIHYLDDYFWCNASFEECLHDLDNLVDLFARLNVPLAPDKLFGPSKKIVFLGIQIDAELMIISLPEDKLSEILSMLECWSRRKKCTKRELLSLIGSLSFATKIIKCGRLFLRRLIDLSTTVYRNDHRISLNAEAQADISWWQEFLPSWNGKEKIHPPPITNFDIELATDASGLGIGASFGNKWFSRPLSDFDSLSWIRRDRFDINFWELFALTVAVLTWGAAWKDKQIIIYVDIITHVWLRGSTDKCMMRLVRKLFLFTAQNNINILLQHIPGHSNILADRLSRLQVSEFKSLLPSADHAGSSIPNTIWLL